MKYQYAFKIINGLKQNLNSNMFSRLRFQKNMNINRNFAKQHLWSTYITKTVGVCPNKEHFYTKHMFKNVLPGKVI